jgi:hypothetical protein
MPSASSLSEPQTSWPTFASTPASPYSENERMADQARRLPGCLLPDSTHRQISMGGGLELATELATELARTPGVDALHIYPLGAEAATRDVAASFRSARGAPAHRR